MTLFHGNNMQPKEKCLPDPASPDSAFILVMTMAILLAFSAAFAGMAGLIKMKSALLSHEADSFYAALESENNFISQEWKNETD